MTYITLTPTDLALAASLLVINGAISLWLRLGLERRLLIAAVRMTVQLLLVGLVLKALFATTSLWLTLGIVVVMIAFAGYEIGRRVGRPLKRGETYTIGAVSMAFAGITVTLLALTTMIGAEPWYDPRYAIPLLGMILGNAMTAVSLSLDRLFAAAVQDSIAIEARLSLGHTFADAMQGHVRDAVRAGLIPTLNSMSAAGIVFLPGMMTGQILAGVPPVDAVKYQLLIMFLIGGATGSGVFLAVTLARRRLTDARHRLRLDRLT
jgi:putative ABC transport system permease protein